jgi:hypothetical protein
LIDRRIAAFTAVQMALVSIREALPFPKGDNSSDTLIAGVHFNLTTLQQWNWTYYSNGTFSNGSYCFLAFEPYTPRLLSNGTFLNETSCYSPINPMGTRSKVGLFFACFFGLSIMFTFVNLRKHGRLFLPQEKRFHAIGRRWQWYWMLVVAAFAIISAIAGVDVDRYYVPELPIVLNNFFWILMLPTTMCVVWESVRHWGSWQERQLVDPNSFALKQDDRRSKVEFWIPLVFYFLTWMVCTPIFSPFKFNKTRTSLWSYHVLGGLSNYNEIPTKQHKRLNQQQRIFASKLGPSFYSAAGLQLSSHSGIPSSTTSLETGGYSTGLLVSSNICRQDLSSQYPSR